MNTQFQLLIDLLSKLGDCNFSNNDRIEMVAHKNSNWYTGIGITFKNKTGAYILDEVGISFDRDKSNFIKIRWYSKANFESIVDVANPNWIDEIVKLLKTNTNASMPL